MYNRATIQGRVVKDIEERCDRSGTFIANWTLASERNHKDKATGKRITEFIDFVAWGELAEHVVRRYKKGDLMIASGEIRTRKYEKDGITLRGFEIAVDEIGYKEGY